MKKRFWGLMVITIPSVILLAAAVIYAGTKMPAKGPIPAPFKYTKNPVIFDHQKHVEKDKIACSQCHHDAQGKPRTDLKPGEDVKPCSDCHSKPGHLTSREARGMSQKDKLAYFSEAFHENCIGCHKKYNKEHKSRIAPQTCNKCHAKKA